MKRYVILLITLAVLAFIAGCGQGSVESMESKTAIETEIGTDSKTGIENDSQNGSLTDIGTDSQTDTKAPDSLEVGSAGESDGQGTEIIAKSGNSISSQNTEEVIDEIDEELDRIIDTINSLEDVADEDLSY